MLNLTCASVNKLHLIPSIHHNFLHVIDLTDYSRLPNGPNGLVFKFGSFKASICLWLSLTQSYAYIFNHIVDD